MRFRTLVLYPSLFLVSCIFLISACKNKPSNPVLFSQYIEAFTSGIISKSEVIKVRLSSAIPLGHTLNEALSEQVFDFDPAVKGQAVWSDAQTLEFRPSENLKPGQTYKVNLHLDKLAKVPDAYSNFAFDFQVIKPAFEIENEGLTAVAGSFDLMQLKGSIVSSDQEEPAAIERILKAEYKGKNTTVKWIHHAETRTHLFQIDSIERHKEDTELKLSWNGSSIGADKTSSSVDVVPRRGDFRVLSVKAINDPEQYVLFSFSDPLSSTQDLRGLVTLTGLEEPRFTIDGSQIKVYAADKLEGSFTAMALEGIRNAREQKLAHAFMSTDLVFENVQPAVTMPGKGTILPGQGKLMIPFEAVNLKAVDVMIIKIFSSNIPQFLQNNGIDGESELRRVGKPMLSKTIRLDADKSLNLHHKNRFFLDIDQMIRTEPGAIYRITVAFRPEYSVYTCAIKDMSVKDDNGAAEGDEGDAADLTGVDENSKFWTAYDNYYPFGYNWEKRNDPCFSSYYNREKWASRNVLASNIGLIAKKGNDKMLHVLVNDLLTTKPMSGVAVEVKDYQERTIAKGSSSSDGSVDLEVGAKPYLLLASSGNQRAYLKLDDGGTLPLTRFDVGGDEIQNGLKGFIYTERDVWRPGDSIFCSFILDDRMNRLPEQYPINFELYNPKGQLIKKMTQSHGTDHFYVFKTATDADDPTGFYEARVKVGGNTFTHSVRVETIMPNRLKIKLDFADQKYFSAGSGSTGDLHAAWLFGGIADHLKARITAVLNPVPTTFKGFDGFTFDDPVLKFNAEAKTVFDGPLDATGSAKINPEVKVGTPPSGMLEENFLIKVFEPGGTFSSVGASMPYHYYHSYVGLKTPKGENMSGLLLTDEDHPVSIVNVDEQGKLLRGDQQVELALYKIEWRWWWEDNTGKLANFTQDKHNQLVKSGLLSLHDGQGLWNLRLNYPNFGRYLLRIRDVKSGHISGQIVYIDWPGWAERVMADNPSDAAMLSFTSDKPSYQVGDEVHLTIPSSKGGRVLVSLESGSKIIKTFWQETSDKETLVNFKAESSMAPNIFANVTMLQPHGQQNTDLPIRMYGVVPIKVEDKKTILKPVIQIPESIKPEARSTVTVSEANGKEMTYTLALVDEGLLDITDFHTPDPHSTFYAREALGVKTWDLYDNVLGTWSGALERILSIGGDQSKLNRGDDVNKSNRFKAVVKFMGPYHLNAGAKNAHSFMLPPYIGALRVMVIAGHEGAFGSAEQSVKVKKPLMILASIPRVLGPGETVSLPVTVFGMENWIKNADVKVETGNLISIDGTDHQSVHFDKPGEQQLLFNLNVKNQKGKTRISLHAVSGAEHADYTVDLAVRNPNPFQTRVQETVIYPGKSWDASYQLIGDPVDSKADLEVSSIPSIGLNKRLGYLIEYPYGCAEQVTSSCFPQLYLSQMTDLSDVQKFQIDSHIKMGINRLKGYQNSEGGIAYWPGASEADEWCTSYAGDFILEAQAKGYVLPSGMLAGWKRFQKSKALNWAPSATNFYGADLEQAYRLYVLALASAPELGAMNRLREFKYLSVAAKWRLAAAYALAGQKETALQMTRSLPMEVKPYRQSEYTFGSDLRDQAMILEALVLLQQRDKALPVLTKLANNLSEDSWYSTQETAFSLLAIAKFCGNHAAGANLDFDYTLNEKVQHLKSGLYLYQSALPLSNSTVKLENKGSNVLYVKLIQQFRPLTGDGVPAENHPDILPMEIEYKNLEGAPVDVTKLAQGTDFVAIVRVRNPGKRGTYNQMALAQIFPSGWEILNSRMVGNAAGLKSDVPTYQDVRDDRVLTYFDLGPKQNQTYSVMLNASYAGRYYLPAQLCEGMYDHTIRASTDGKWVEVIPAGLPKK